MIRMKKTKDEPYTATRDKFDNKSPEKEEPEVIQRETHKSSNHQITQCSLC